MGDNWLENNYLLRVRNRINSIYAIASEILTTGSRFVGSGRSELSDSHLFYAGASWAIEYLFSKDQEAAIKALEGLLKSQYKTLEGYIEKDEKNLLAWAGDIIRVYQPDWKGGLEDGR